jgi:hypothetical protein
MAVSILGINISSDKSQFICSKNMINTSDFAEIGI